MSYGERIFAEDISLDTTRNSKADGTGNDISNSDPTDLGFDADGNLLVADYTRGKLFFYQVAASDDHAYGDAVKDNDWALTGIANPQSFITDGTHTLVYDGKVNDFNAFTDADKAADTSEDITKAKLAQGQAEGWGIVGFTIDDADTVTVYGVDSINAFLRAYSFAGARVPASDRDLRLTFLTNDIIPRYASYNGGVVFFSDAANQRVMAMELATGNRLPHLEWPLIEGHQINPANKYDGGILVTDTRAYMVDVDNLKVVVYDRENHTVYGRPSVTV